MKQTKARLMNLESITRSNNQEPNFYFVEDASNEPRPHYTATLELAGWTIFVDEGESTQTFHERIKKEYKQAVKLKGKRLEKYVVLFGKNPE